MVEKTNSLLDEIDSQYANMVEELLAVKEIMKSATPSTKEQIKTANRINNDVATQEKILRQLDEEMERNEKEKDRLMIEHDKCD